MSMMPVMTSQFATPPQLTQFQKSIPSLLVPQVANVSPRPVRDLTPQEVATVQARLNAAQPETQKGFDIPTANMIANPNKQALLGVVLNGILGFLFMLLLNETALKKFYATTSVGAKLFSAAMTGLILGTIGGTARYKATEAKNAFAINLLQHGVTHYDNLPQEKFNISPAAWKQINGIA